MKQPLTIFLSTVLAGLAMPGAAPHADAQEPVAPDPSDFPAYSLIQERNIFNPNRYRRSDNAPPPRDTRPEPEPGRVEFFSLLGTMSYEKGCYAYFNGSNAEFRKTVQAQDTIGGHKVVAISTSNVRLEHEGKELTMKVGMQLKRQNQGEWELVTETSGSLRLSQSGKSPDSGGSPRTSNTSKPSGDTTSPGDSSSEDDDILKRLLQKREQELNNEK